MKGYLKEIYFESGIRNITKLAKEYDKAQLYFHMDLDGVTSALAIKEYLKNYGITVISAEVIQYGDKEYSIKKPQPKTLQVLVDFAHGKPMMHIHTDHHQEQTGVSKEQSTAFSHTPSNVAYISQTISPTEIFPPQDIILISTIDSADFAKQDYTVDDVIQAVFSLDKEKEIKTNKANLGFVVNKLLLAFKNKPNFLSTIVMEANPSLMSMYNVIKKIIKKEGYKSAEEVQADHKRYGEQQKQKLIEDGTIEDIKNLKSGEHIMIGNVIVQFASYSEH